MLLAALNLMHPPDITSSLTAVLSKSYLCDADLIRKNGGMCPGRAPLYLR
jgi:hypothetical protein